MTNSIAQAFQIQLVVEVGDLRCIVVEGESIVCFLLNAIVLGRYWQYLRVDCLCLPAWIREALKDVGKIR